MGGNQEDTLAAIVDSEGARAAASVSSGATSSGVGEGQRHHPSGGPGDYGPAD